VVDISAFNAMMSNIKVRKHNLFKIQNEIRRITIALKEYKTEKNNIQFEAELSDKLSRFNNQFFPSPEYKFKVR
jgi:hypothetical protein